MVSSRLSLCTRTPVGNTPRMATNAIAMTPRLMAISTMVKPLTHRRGRARPEGPDIARNPGQAEPKSGTTSNIQHPTSNIQRGAPCCRVVSWLLVVGCWLSRLGVRETADGPSDELDLVPTILIQKSDKNHLNFGRVASSTLARPVSQLMRMKWFV